jgi:O-antigen/teichoic acid export membrane protein
MRTDGYRGGCEALHMTAATQPSSPRRPAQEGPLRGTVFAMLAQIATAVGTAAVTLYLVRALGPAQYGELALVLSVGGLALVLADGAVAQSTGRFAAQVVDDPEAVARVLAAGLRLKLWLALGVGALLLVLATPVSHLYGAPRMAPALRIGALAVVAESLFLQWIVAFQSLRRLAVNVRLYAVESAAETAAVIGLVAAGSGVTGAVLGRATGYAVGAAAGLVLMGRLLGRSLSLRDGDAASRRTIGGYALPLFVSSSAYTAYSQVDVQLIATILDRTAVGLFSAPSRLLTLLALPGQSVANAVSPRMAGPDPDVPAFVGSLRWVLLLHAALVPPVVLWSQPICLLLLGPSFTGSATVLAALAPYLYLRGVSVLASTTVNYLGHARRRIPIVLLSLVVNVVLGIVLLHVMGVVGAALALGISYAFYVPLHLRICAESFALPMRALARTLARSAVAAGAMSAVLLAVGTSDLDLAQWLVGALGGTAAFVAALVATRELGRRELDGAIGWWRGRARAADGPA